MKLYKKPIITLDTGVAEGVVARHLQQTLNWYSAPFNAEISVQVQGNDIKKLECTGASYSNN